MLTLAGKEGPSHLSHCYVAAVAVVRPCPFPLCWTSGTEKPSGPPFYHLEVHTGHSHRALEEHNVASWFPKQSILWLLAL